jgi:hypothetical protein
MRKQEDKGNDKGLLDKEDIKWREWWILTDIVMCVDDNVYIDFSFNASSLCIVLAGRCFKRKGEIG